MGTNKYKRKKYIAVITMAIVIVIFCGIYVLLHHNNPVQRNISYAHVHDTTLAYYTRGTGTPLILINGFGMTMDKWDPLLLEKLSQNHKLILYDDRGVGSSNNDISELSESQMAGDAIGLMDSLHIQKSDILGWSMGSFIAQIVAESYPNRVNKLLLVSTSLGTNQFVQNSTTVAIANTIQDNITGTWEDVFVPSMFANKDALANYLERLHTAIQTQEVPQDVPENEMIRNAQEQVLSDVTQEQERTDNLARIQAPTLIVAGDKDQLILPENDKLVAARIPNADLVIIPNAGHAVLFENIDAFMNAVNEFLRD